METGAAKSSESKENEGTAEKKTPKGWQEYWEKEKQASDKRARKFNKQGNQIVRRYLDERENEADSLYTAGYRGVQPSRLNLFHTNVSTLQSMLFGQIPKIDVSREHQDPDDDDARVASMLFQRILEADTLPSGEDLGTVLRASLQDRLLPGIGQARVKYSCTICKSTVTDMQGNEVEVETVTDESCNIVYVHWQDFRWGWCRTWKEAPWLGFRIWLDKEEATARFGAKKANKLTYKNQLPTGVEHKDESYSTDQKNNVQKAEIWEFWHMAERQVFWFQSGQDVVLDQKDDPLKLDGFWPCPRPLIANPTTTLLMPRADFVIAQDLYNEIDELQGRISTITRAVKVVGVYDKSAGDSVGRMLKEGVENDLIPVDNWAMFAEKGGLAGVIDWFPVQEVVNTLQTLITIRDQTIELLYQVTGMSDILRGANTEQYTSDGTQQLKAKFGSIRVQSLQDEFARFASDLDALKAEVISKHFSPSTIIQQSNANFIPEADKGRLTSALSLMKSPDIRWRVTIRPESIAMVDYAQLKAERTEFLTAMATYVQSAQAAVQQIPGSLPVLLELMKWGMVGFKGSDYLEGTMDQAIEMAKNAPPPGQDDSAMQEQAQQHQFDMQKIQAKAEADMQLQAHKHQNAMQEEMQKHQDKLQQEQQDHQNEMQKLIEEFKAEIATLREKLAADLAVEEAQSGFAAAEEELEHQNTMTEKQHDAKVAARQQNRQTDTD